MKNILAALLVIIGMMFFFGSLFHIEIFGIGWIITGFIMMFIGFGILNKNTDDITFC